MAENRTLSIRSIPDEPKTSKKGDKFWVSTDGDGVEWLVWRNEALRNEVAARVDKAVEYVVAINQSGDKTYRSIEGIPGVVEPEKKGGSGGFRKSDPVERASIEAQVALKAAVELAISVIQQEPEVAVRFVETTTPRLYSLLRKMSGASSPDGGTEEPKAGEGRSNPNAGTAQGTEPASPAAPALPTPATCPKGGDHDFYLSGVCKRCGAGRW